MGRPKGSKNRLPSGRDARHPSKRKADRLRNEAARETRLKAAPPPISLDPVVASLTKPEAPRPADVPTDTQRVYTQFLNNPLLWLWHYFPNHMRIESPPFHIRMMREALLRKYLAIGSPRESSKSTIITFGYAAHAIAFKRKRFIVILQNNFSKAAMSLETIKKEFKDNALLKEGFPGITITKDAEGDSVFTHSDGFATKILCKGEKEIGSIRGVKFGAYRPDLFILDDVEDDELVKNISRRTELRQEFDEVILPAGEKGLCQYVAVGTIMHDDSLLAHILNKEAYKEFTKLLYRALQADGTSLWPEKWDVDYLRTLEKNKPHVFAKEYQNDPVAGANVRFRKEDFRIWRQEGADYLLLDIEGKVVSRGALADCRAAIACDLAWKEAREADSTVLMPGLLTPNADFLIDTYVCEAGLRPDQIAEYLFTMEARLRALTSQSVPIGFEKAMLENVTQWILRNEMRRRNVFLLTKELAWDADKITRIETRLLPRYRQHVLYHRHGMGDLEHQLERFPYGAHDDLPDCVQGLVQLLQYPRARAKETAPVDAFMRMRQLAIESKKPRQTGLFSITHQSQRRRGLPVIVSPL